ncbi:hypothetical protein [Salinicoccus sp. CNSTN-B1]
MSLVLIIGGISLSVAVALQFINIPISLFVQLVTPQHIKGRCFQP